MAPPPSFKALDSKVTTRAQAVLEAAQAPISPPATPEAPVAQEAAAKPSPPTTPRGWLGVVRSALVSPFTNAVALRDAPSELWVCFWCAGTATIS